MANFNMNLSAIEISAKIGGEDSGLLRRIARCAAASDAGRIYQAVRDLYTYLVEDKNGGWLTQFSFNGSRRDADAYQDAVAEMTKLRDLVREARKAAVDAGCDVSHSTYRALEVRPYEMLVAA